MHDGGSAKEEKESKKEGGKGKGSALLSGVEWLDREGESEEEIEDRAIQEQDTLPPLPDVEGGELEGRGGWLWKQVSE